jgi:PAS domain-containing protein
LEAVCVSTFIPSAYKRIIEDMREGVLVLDAQNRVVELNPAAQEISGIAIKQVVGEHVCQALPFLAGLSDALENIEDGGERLFEERIGQWNYEVRLVPIWDEGGKFAGRILTLYAAAEQLTGKKELLSNGEKFHHVIAELRTLEQRLRAIFENAAIGIAIVDRDGQYIRGTTILLRCLAIPMKSCVRCPILILPP